jgi:hypothetical protein
MEGIEITLGIFLIILIATFVTAKRWYKKNKK